MKTMLRRGLLLGSVAAVLAAGGGWWIYSSSPKVRALLQPLPSATREPLGFLDNLPVLEPRKAAAPKKARRQTTSRPRQEVSPEAVDVSTSPPANQVPNQEVARTLLQILAAQGLASGISLSVGDTQIDLMGEVASQETLRRILEILDRGREARALRYDEVVVTGP